MSFLDTLFKGSIGGKVQQLRDSISSWYNTPVTFYGEGSAPPIQTPTTTPRPTNIPPQVTRTSPTPTPIPSNVTELPNAQRPYQEEINRYWQEKSNIANQILRYKNPATGEILGENTAYQAGRSVDIPNANGSIDRGLFRINSNTFLDFMERKSDILSQNGIYNWDDMLDPLKNAAMARIVYDEQGAGAWFAAPPWLR